MTKKVETANGGYMENEKAKVELEDIIGVIDCEPTDSVKEVKRLRGRFGMTEKERFTVDGNGKYWDKIENKYVTIDHLFRLVESLEKEKEQLKKQKARYKRLSESRNEDIDNRILTIKEFIDNCSNEEVKKALEDLFYSEVNEYDLSKKYRKLHEENEDLKEDNAILKQALTRLVEAFNDHISDKSPVRDLIK